MLWWYLPCVILLLTINKASAACSSSVVNLSASSSNKVAVTSPNYPSNYANSEDCQWRIDSGSSSKYVILEFTSFTLENNYDYLYIYDGSSTSSSSLGAFTGSSLTFIKSTSRYLTIRFTSDYSVGRSGFQAYYFSVDSTAEQVDCSTTSLPYSAPAQLVSLNFPNVYSSYSSCHALLDAGSSQIFSITLLFTDYTYTSTPDCSNGGLVIYDGSSTSSTGLLRQCSAPQGGTTYTVYTSGQYAYIKYRYNSNSQYHGFVLAYSAYGSAGATTISQNVITAVAVTSTCSTQLSLTATETETRYINSPNYPSTYGNNLDCGYLITSSVSGYTTIQIEIVYLDIETCCDDFIVYDGSSASYGSFGTVYTGTIFKSTGSSVYIVFKTDGSVVKGGFSLTYRAVEEVIPTCASSFTAYYASTSSQTIQSPNYPSYYDSNSVTYWLIIKPDSDDTLTYNFESFRLEYDTSCDSYDYLIVYNGACETSSVIDRYCGYEDDTLHTHTYGKYVLFKMVTDSSSQYSGFSMKYNVGSDSNEEEEDSTVKAGMITGVVVGVTAFIVIVTIVCVKNFRKTKISTATKPAKENPLKINKHPQLIIKQNNKQPTKQKARQTTVPTAPKLDQISIIPQPQPPVYPPPFQPISDPAYPPAAPPGGTYMAGGGMFVPNYSSSNPPVHNPSVPSPFEYKPAYR